MQDDEAFCALLRTDLTSFILKTFCHLSPGRQILLNWHIEVIAEHLEAANNGQIKRLIISMPPRNLKSVCTNVAWTAWTMGHNPASRIITASYSRELSIKHALDARSVVTSQWFGRTFPNFAISKSQNSKTKFATSMQGSRLATSVDSTITGEGADYIILDDPHNPMHIFSEKRRNKVIDWFEQVVMSRLNDRDRGVIVIIMHRLHKSDLVGWLLSGMQQWTTLSIPIIAEHKVIFPLRNGNMVTVNSGDLMHSARYSMDDVQQIKQEVGAYVFASQYMQRPIDVERNPIKAQWLQRYRDSPPSNIVISWDTAGTKMGCYSVGSVWSSHQGAVFLLDIIRGRWHYHELKKKIIESYDKWKAKATLIENKSSGQLLINDLPPHIKVLPINPKEDKMERLMRVAPLFENGKVRLPEHAAWLVDLEYELLSFPDSEYDDQVDSLSQYLNWLLDSREGMGGGRKITVL